MASVPVETIAKALKAKAGNVTEAAKALGVTRQTVHNRIKASPTLQQVVQDEREALVDIAELALRREVANGNMTAIIWTLKASPAAKARGWSERQEVTGADGGPIEYQNARERIQSRIDSIAARIEEARGDSGDSADSDGTGSA